MGKKEDIDYRTRVLEAPFSLVENGQVAHFFVCALLPRGAPLGEGPGHFS
jgi:hypothetical protein